MSDNTKLEIAVEIMATTIAMYSQKGYTAKSDEMQNFIEERYEMYKGNEKIIDKIIKKYGTEIKENYDKI